MNDKQIYLKKIFDVFSMGIKPRLEEVNNIKDNLIFAFILPFVGLDRVSGSTFIDDILENGFTPIMMEEINSFLDKLILFYSNNDKSVFYQDISKQADFYWISILKNYAFSFLDELNYETIRGSEITNNTIFGLAIDKRRKNFLDANALVPFTPFKFVDGVCTHVLLGNNTTIHCNNIEVFLTVNLMEKN